MVFLKENVAASTSVACWEAVLVKGSLLIWVTATWPCKVRANVITNVILNNKEKDAKGCLCSVRRAFLSMDGKSFLSQSLFLKSSRRHACSGVESVLILKLTPTKPVGCMTVGKPCAVSGKMWGYREHVLEEGRVLVGNEA